MENKFARLARRCGVVGAGGAGFPTHVKLNAKVDCLIVNGAECEPLMSVDQYLLLKDAEPMAAVLDQIRLELGAAEARIGIKAKHKDVIGAVTSALEGRPAVRVIPLDDAYPAGDEYVLVYETTGRQIPQGGIPLDCGVVVINAETLWNLWQAEEGRTLTHKWVTVAGEVARPGVYHVPLGISIAEILRTAQVRVNTPCRVINGGPMMGSLVENPSDPVTKTTKGILVLPESTPAVVNRLRPIEQILRLAQAACCQCNMCTDLCPRHLLGYGIHPNRTILSAGYSWSTGASGTPEALLCSECGACDMYACPMGLSPRRVNHMLKQMLAKEKIPAPEKGKAVTENPWRPYRKIPSKRLIRRLNLEGYNSPVEFVDADWGPERIVLPLKQHIGVPAQSMVTPGQKVACGELVADIPPGSLSSALFASIDGIVEEVIDSIISIRKVRGESL